MFWIIVLLSKLIHISLSLGLLFILPKLNSQKYHQNEGVSVQIEFGLPYLEGPSAGNRLL